MRILFVLTSQGRMGAGDRPTGLWIEEFTAPYFLFRDAGAAITLASPLGGPVPTDPTGNAVKPVPPSVARFRDDAAAQSALTATRPLAAIAPHGFPQGFDAIFYPGGLGPMWDLAADPHSRTLIETAFAAATPIAFVCHGQAALAACRAPDGRPLVAGRRLTAFSRAEDEAAGLVTLAPFVLEDRLRALGADFRHGPPDAPFIVRDGHLLTGQNPASSLPLAEALLALLTLEPGSPAP
ncbi:ThiJ/PfpI domain-containing protein [Sphingomonas sp. MM-1]|uniref:type 1 glutamine amidotransferase domain-containing protein n=1 Tax=Sphingomonas sp. MM-1 TaxID=745310 RepID=UPI0002C07BC9|nr:type 1 glutamine amidotransferase domain-containing protein [Sphingomonas sp. MM-1]AGH50779.1 ThiJ/PfpI domain-containing protein [Sphingomonas sp. MM-1]